MTSHFASNHVNSTKKFIKNIFVRFFSRATNLSRLYYWLINDSFTSENHAVMRGRAKYLKDLKNNAQSSSYLLRRNIHRLEKGLIMMPRRNIFAESFISETVDKFSTCAQLQSNNNNNAELKWYHDVLREYFDCTSSDSSIINAAREKFNIIPFANDNKAHQSSSPICASKINVASINYPELIDFLSSRKSVRWYQDIRVSKNDIKKLIDAAALAPTACNRQPYRFIATNQNELASQISRCAGGTKGYEYQIPAIIVVVGDLSAYAEERDRHLIYIDSALASMQLILTAQSLGLSSCAINWPDIKSHDREVQKYIQIHDYERIIMLISVGYALPSGGIPFSQKKQHPDLLTFIS